VSHDEYRPDHLVAHAAGDQPALILIHTWPEETRVFGPLAERSNPDRPLYALVSPDAEVCAGLDAVDDWVAQVVPRLRALPVEPPYHLGGWSFGGVVALEVAHHLREAGVGVTSVHLIDTWLPRRRPRDLRGRTGRMARKLRTATWATRRAYGRAFARALAVRLHLRRRPPPKAVDPRKRAIWVPYLRYVPGPAPAPAFVYAASDSVAQHAGDPTLGFGPWLTAGCETVAIDGGHWDLFEPPGIDVLAAALERGVAAAGAEGGPPEPL
jgi:thioesterase domain-containing protein